MMTSKSKRVYIFKVALKDDKRTWRRIAMRGDQTLDSLHEAIFEAFDRDEEHLYTFYFPKPESRGRDRWHDAREYAHPYILEDNPFGDRDLHNAAETRLDELKLEKGQKLDYLFDFGDSWWHEITVEKTDGEVETGLYPRIVEKRGESPPQYYEEEGAEDE